MNKPKNKIKFDKTFKSQIELLPRLTIIYGNGLEGFVIAFEFLWFSLYFQKV
jgi:hypothetical protein